VSQTNAKGIAVVTGAGRGIGRATALALADRGLDVALLARTFPQIEETAAAIVQRGRRALALRCDVSLAKEVHHAAARTEAELGTPTVVVNNAGVVRRALVQEMEESELDLVLDVNLKGTFLVTRAFLPLMRARRSGRIINIASIAGRQGTAGLGAYCAAKHGVVGLTRALAVELRDEGIVANAVCPGSVDTDMLRVGRPGAKADMSPEDVAGVVLYLAAHAPLALTGSCVDVFG